MVYLNNKDNSKSIFTPFTFLDNYFDSKRAFEMCKIKKYNNTKQ
jgi:hypothetical protein